MGGFACYMVIKKYTSSQESHDIKLEKKGKEGDRNRITKQNIIFFNVSSVSYDLDKEREGGNY